MTDDTRPRIKQNELFIEYGQPVQLVEMNVDAKHDGFNLTFDNVRLWSETTGQVLIKCRLPDKKADLTLQSEQINESTFRRLMDLSRQQEQMRRTTDSYKEIPAWLENSLQRISDLRLGRDLLNTLVHERLVEMEIPPNRKFDLQSYINDSLQKEVNELTQHLRVQPDGIAHIRKLLQTGGSAANAPMIRYGLNAVNNWNAPQLQDALRWIANQLSLPDDVRNAAASYL